MTEDTPTRLHPAAQVTAIVCGTVLAAWVVRWLVYVVWGE